MGRIVYLKKIVMRTFWPSFSVNECVFIVLSQYRNFKWTMHDCGAITQEQSAKQI